MAETTGGTSSRRGSKSPEAFRTISEVASDLDVPQHVLRFWESKFAQIRPLKRGGGRRYYRPEDVDLLRGIRHLLYSDGFTIKGVQKLLRENGAKSVMESGRTLASHGAASAAAALSLRRTSEQDDDPQAAATDSPGDPDREADRINAILEELVALRDMLRQR